MISITDQGLITAFKFFAAALPTLAFGYIAQSLSNIASAWLSGIARNPEASDKMGTPGILALAMTESIALFGLMISMLLIFGVGGG